MYENDDQADATSGRRSRAPSLGEEAAAIVGERDPAGERLAGMAQEERLREWAEAGGHLVADAEWEALTPVSAITAEHEVRYRQADNRAVKRTWPGTFGCVPKRVDGAWEAKPATPFEYLERHRLQNELFADDVRVEGVMLSSQPSMIIGQTSSGVSLVVSQPWIEARDDLAPHPSEPQIAAYFEKRGFFRILNAFFGWENPDAQLVIIDAKPDNFILTDKGVIPIDLLIAQIEPDQP